MKVGDLVKFRYCAMQGQIGMVTSAPDPSQEFADRPSLHLYFVACSSGNQCFTGDQLEVINESR